MKIELPKSEMDIFNKLVVDQFEYGGKKYSSADDKSNNKKESTDYLFEDFTYLWLIGTIGKYCKRYTNVKREKDLLKIACYSFITWLKRGYHITPQGTPKVINTNVDLKSECFPVFISGIEAYETSGSTNIDDIYYTLEEFLKSHLNKTVFSHVSGKVLHRDETTLKELLQQGFLKLDEEDLFFIYKTCYVIWKDNFSDNPGKDTDTNNG